MSQWATAILNEIIGRLSARFGDKLIMLFGCQLSIICPQGYWSAAEIWGHAG